MAVSLAAAAAFHWFGVDYAAGAPVDVTGWSDRAIAQLIKKAPVVAAASGGSTPVGLGDYAFWTRGSAVDSTSGSFNFVTDLQAHAGTSITVDSSDAWVTTDAGWGYAVPQVTVAGTYQILYAVQDGISPGELHGPAVFDSGGSNLHVIQNPANFAAPIADTQGGPGPYHGMWSASLYLPAGTHFDFSTPATVDSQVFMIQKIA